MGVKNKPYIILDAKSEAEKAHIESLKKLAKDIIHDYCGGYDEEDDVEDVKEDVKEDPEERIQINDTSSAEKAKDIRDNCGGSDEDDVVVKKEES